MKPLFDFLRLIGKSGRFRHELEKYQEIRLIKYQPKVVLTQFEDTVMLMCFQCTDFLIDSISNVLTASRNFNLTIYQNSCFFKHLLQIFCKLFKK